MNDLLYIYTYLDDETPVLAGAMNSVEQDGSKMAFFRYSPEYLARKDRYALDPIHLPLPKSDKKVFETPTEHNISCFGIFLDSVPDNWGRTRMQRAAGRDLSPIEYVLASGEDRLGALAFGLTKDGPGIVAPWSHGEPSHGYLNLDSLTAALADDSYELPQEQTRELLLYGSSLGGARPKATVLHNGQLWMAKAPRRDDEINMVELEHGTMELARRAGFEVPETKIIDLNGKSVYLIKRFDREFENGALNRYPVMSAFTAFGFPKQKMRIQSEATYNILAKTMDKISKDPAADKKELFKRVALNVLVGNTDDHSKNHSFIYKDGGWRLSPLYDVVPVLNLGPEGYLSMRFGSEGSKRSLDNLLSSTKDFGLTKLEASRELHQLTTIVKSWHIEFEGLALSAADRKGLESTFSIMDKDKAQSQSVSPDMEQKKQQIQDRKLDRER